MKNLTALWKLLILTATLGSLTACGTTLPQQSGSVRSPSVVAYTTPSDLVNVTSLVFTRARFGLSDIQKQKQSAAVYSALESDYGVVYQWFERDAMGAVKAVHGYPQGSGYCRVIYSMITVKGRQRHFEETACVDAGHEGWRFVRK